MWESKPPPRALLPFVLSARDTVAGTSPGISWSSSRVIGHPRLTDSPPCLISVPIAKAAEPPAQHHSQQGLWGAGLVAGLAPTPNQEPGHPSCLCSLIPSLLLCPPRTAAAGCPELHRALSSLHFLTVLVCSWWWVTGSVS